MNLRNRLFGARMLLVGALAFSLAGAIPRARGQEQEAKADPSKAIIEYSRSPNDVVIQMDRRSSHIPRLPESPPELRIYGDGRVRIHSHWPNEARIKGYDAETAKRKGMQPPSQGKDYGLQFSEKEMSELLHSLSERGIMTFDWDVVKRSMLEVDREMNREVLPSGDPFGFSISNGDSTTIDVWLTRYRPVGMMGGPVKTNLHNRIRVESVDLVREDRKLYPNVRALRDLYDARKELWAMLRREDRQDLDEE